MPINLKPPAKQSFLPSTDPIQSWQNPVQDFLAPFKQTKTELEGKISQIASWNNPQTLPEINASNWEQFQWSNPNWSNYQPQSLIDYNRTGKTTSQLMGEWAIPSTTNTQPMKMNYQNTPEPSWITKFVAWAMKWVDNLTGWAVTGWLKTLANSPEGQSPDQVLWEWAQNEADIANKIKNAGYGDISPEKESKIKDYIKQKLDAWVSPDVIKQALAKAKADWKLQGSWSDNPITGTLASIASAPFQGAAGLFGGEAKFAQGAWNLFDWKTDAGIAQMGEGILWSYMWALGLATWFTPGGAAVNTAFNSDTVSEPMHDYMVDPMKKVTAGSQELLGYDPNSEASKSVQESVWMVWPLAVLHPGQKYGAPKVTEWLKNVYSRMWKEQPVEKPVMNEWVNAISSEWVQGNVEKPWIIAGVQDKIFWSKNDTDLAGKAVSPRAVKSKWPSQKAEWNKKAYEGIQQLHDDSVAWRIDTNISTMQWWAEWIEQALSHWGKRIWELTNNDGTVKVDDIVSWLKDHMQDPLSNLSWPVKWIANSIIDVFSNEKYKDGMTIFDVQQAMSDIKSQIFSDHKLVQALSKETAGRWVNDFINSIDSRFTKAIDESSGNSMELQRAKQIYSKYKAIQWDFMQSLLVNNRNSKIGATGRAGIIMWLYELSKWWASAIPKVLALKYITWKMWEYWTRSGAYEKLIRNMDRKALQRAEWKYNTGDKSITDSSNGNISNYSRNISSKRPSGIKLLPAPSWEASWARNFRVNQSFDRSPKPQAPDITEKSIIKRPEWEVKTVNPVLEMMSAQDHDKMITSMKKDIATNTLAARYNGTGNERIQSYIESALANNKIGRQDAVNILLDIYDSVSNKTERSPFAYVDLKKLDDYITKFMSSEPKKVETFDDLVNKWSETPQETPKKVPTPKELFDEINHHANDGRFAHTTIDRLLAEFKQKTGRDANEISYTDFASDGSIKPQETPKSESSQVVKDESPIKKEIIPKKAEVKPVRLYHWTNADFTEFNSKFFWKWEWSSKIWKWVYLTENKTRASEYGKNVKEVDISWSKLINWDDIKYDERYDDFLKNTKLESNSDIKEAFAKKYFDWIKYWKDEILIFDPNKAKIIPSKIKDIIPKLTKSESKVSILHSSELNTKNEKQVALLEKNIKKKWVSERTL